MIESLTAVSLFSSGGIGDLAVHASGIRTLVANELLEDRARIYEKNFPDALMLVGDISELKETIVSEARRLLGNAELDFVFATPPCQGMSKNGRGKLLQGIRAGLKPELDVRNQLMLPTLDIICALRPRVVVIENVPEMENTIIRTVDGRYIQILDLIEETLSPLGYRGSAEVVEFADFGVPQRRQRLITIYSRAHIAGQSLFPQRTHARNPSLLEKPWVTVDDVIGQVPPLDAKDLASARSSIFLHRVPLLDESKYFWVSNTPPGGGAFDNQCVNPLCGFQGNLTHTNKRSADGINQSSKSTPITCSECGSLLPRPWTVKNGKHQLMSGFTSAYKRMRGDLPASALTRNLSYACSDQKLHPRQNRVLSLHEACIIHTIEKYEYAWERSDGKRVPDKLIRDVIGESIPPAGLQFIFEHMVGQLRAMNRLAA